MKWILECTPEIAASIEARYATATVRAPQVCHDITRHGGYGFLCSECGWEAYEPNDYGNDVSFDFDYCPGCGRMVD